MPKKLETAQVSLPSDRAVRVARALEAPRALVYEAYTEPELMKRWLLGPPGWSMPVCEMDVRPGGRFRWRWRSDEDGSEFGFHGEFLEVDAPVKLRHTQIYDPGDAGGSVGDMGDDAAIVTIRLTERNGVTTVTTLIEYASEEDRDAALSTGMTDGMDMSYAKLDEWLADGGLD